MAWRECGFFNPRTEATYPDERIETMSKVSPFLLLAAFLRGREAELLWRGGSRSVRIIVHECCLRSIRNDKLSHSKDLSPAKTNY